MASMSARCSSSLARREGIGAPPAPLCAGLVELAKPTAPAAMASRTNAAICAISSAVAARWLASAPITQVRSDEWPTYAARLIAQPVRRSCARYSAKVSNSQRTPRCSTSNDMPSTCVRLRIVSSRSCGRHGAMVKPQLPITAVVTPSAGEGRAYGSQVSWAS